MNRSQYRRATSSVVAVLLAVLVMVTLPPPGRAAASPAETDVGPPPPVEENSKPFDGTFSSGLRSQTWRDPGPRPVIVNAAPTVVTIPAGAHDSLEVDLTINQGVGDPRGVYGIQLDMAVSSGGTPADLDWQWIFSNHRENATERLEDVRLTWDHRVAPGQAMNLHVRCHTIVDPRPGEGCAIADIRGFEDTPGGWDPIAWNGLRSHAFGIYAEEMPLVVLGESGPRITSDGDANPFLGVERDLSGEGVRLRGPLVTLPEFTSTDPLSASIRWRRTTDAVPPDSSVELVVRFMPIDNPWAERTLIVIPRGTSTSDWQTQASGPLPPDLAGKAGHFVIDPVDFSLGPSQAVGLDSLTFYLNDRAVDIPLTPCSPGPMTSSSTNTPSIKAAVSSGASVPTRTQGSSHPFWKTARPRYESAPTSRLS